MMKVQKKGDLKQTHNPLQYQKMVILNSHFNCIRGIKDFLLQLKA